MSDDKINDRIMLLVQEVEQSQARERTVSDLLEKKLGEIHTLYHRTIG